MVIFVSSIGRSGTRFIANLFNVCTEIPSFHAKEPHCHGDENFSHIYKGRVPPDLTDKISQIREIHDETNGYMESSQLFNRILSKEILRNFDDVRVVHLLRDPLEVAKSYLNRDSYPDHPNRQSRPWRLPLNTPLAEFQFDFGVLTPLQQNLCDWLDNELKFTSISSKLSKIAGLDFENMSNFESLCKLLTDLAVPFNADDLKRHLDTGKDLDTNSNPQATEIAPQDTFEANTLLEKLHSSPFPNRIFKQSKYLKFPFINALVTDSLIEQPLIDQLVCRMIGRG